MSTDWYARKLSGAAPSRAPQQQSYPGTPQPPPYVPPVPPSQQPQVTGDNIAQVAGLWKGGKATKTETTKCPHCGGDNYFSMSNGESLGGAGARLMTQSGAVTTSPRCFSCGYNSAFGLQTGSM